MGAEVTQLPVLVNIKAGGMVLAGPTEPPLATEVQPWAEGVEKVEPLTPSVYVELPTSTLAERTALVQDAGVQGTLASSMVPAARMAPG